MSNFFEKRQAKHDAKVQKIKDKKEQRLSKYKTDNSKCPSCGSIEGWNQVNDDARKGFSGGKAVAGAVVFGPVGLAAGALGKTANEYYCRECGFRDKYKK